MLPKSEEVWLRCWQWPLLPGGLMSLDSHSNRRTFWFPSDSAHFHISRLFSSVHWQSFFVFITSRGVEPPWWARITWPCFHCRELESAAATQVTGQQDWAVAWWKLSFYQPASTTNICSGNADLTSSGQIRTFYQLASTLSPAVHSSADTPTSTADTAQPQLGVWLLAYQPHLTASQQDPVVSSVFIIRPPRQFVDTGWRL